LKKTGLVTSPEYLKHIPPYRHPENPERLKTILNLLKEKKIFEKVLNIEPEEAKIEDIQTTHLPFYIEEVKKISLSGGGNLDPDTYLCSETYKIALLASGGVLQATEFVIENKVKNAVALIRPPGHHAEKDRGMGFCIFNNIAIAANFAKKKGLNKILIVDWDLHHGNGTQNIFYGDEKVLYFSTHQYPYYPGTGSIQEIGTGKGRGYTINIPLPGGCGDSDYEYIFNEILIPVSEKFKPEIIFISAGFDAHYLDPLGGMNLSSRGYGNLTEIVKSIAENFCEGKIVVALEGGYNLDALANSVLFLINSLAELNLEIEDFSPLKKREVSSSVKNIIKEVKSFLKEYWF
jgi:acetoin utilization deacetylase AcuC-like enzyme